MHSPRLSELEAAISCLVHRWTTGLLLAGLAIVGLAAIPMASPVLTGVTLISLAATAMGARRRVELACLQAGLYALLYVVFFGAVVQSGTISLSLRLADLGLSIPLVLAHIPVLKQAWFLERT